MKADKTTVKRFFSAEDRIFSIPVYQRNYDWKDVQCKKLFNDIEKILENEHSQHFIGTIVYVNSTNNDNIENFIIIDGQQRLTSLTLFTKAILDLTEEARLKERINDECIINKYQKEDAKIKLKLIKEDFENYKSLLENDFNKICKDSNIFKNYTLFKELLQKSRFKLENIYMALSKLELVYIELECNKASENPQLIFESLNSTGLSLTQSDLIRNYLLMNQSYENQESLYNDYWYKIEKNIPNSKISSFIRAYLIMKTGNIPNENHVYEKFKDFKNNKKNIQFNDEYFLKELYVYSKYYHMFLNKNSENEYINKLLRSIELIKSTVVYPFLLYLFYNTFEEEKITISDLTETIHTIISFLFRRQVCNYKTNALSGIFADTCRHIENEPKETYNEKLLNILVRNNHFPKNKEFKENFIQNKFYKNNKSNLCKYILFEIEIFHNKEIVDDENITIEHIMPQTLTSAWKTYLGNEVNHVHTEYLHTIGNLTLTGYNSELSNKNFEDKKMEFKNSNISITRKISNYDVWDKQSIIKRAEILYETAEVIWGLPEEYNNFKEEIDLDEKYSLDTSINVTGRTPKSIVIEDTYTSNDNKINISSWTEFLRALSRYFYDKDVEVFKNFINDTDFKGKKKNLIDDNKENMREPYQLESNLFIETKLGALQILSLCKSIADKYDYIDKIYFYLKK